MATNDILRFSPTDTGTNLLTQAAYLADAQRINGNQPGMARGQLVNKAMRQSSLMTSLLAQYISDLTGDDVLDDGTTTNILATMKKAHGMMPQNIQSANYNVALADIGAHILHPSADTTARIYTIPANASVAFPIGAVVTIVNQNAAGVISIAITSDTMRQAGSGTTGTRTLAANGIATILKVTATEWIISGTGIS